MGRASAILGGLLLFFLLLVWFYRWAVRHETDIKRRWGQFLQRPRIVALRLRFAPQLAFLHARLSPRSYLGLNLTLGALVLIGASWLFGGIAEDVLTGDPLTLIDVRVAEWFHARATPFFTQSMLVITNLHGPTAVSILMAVSVLYLAWQRDWYWLICLMVTVPSGMLLNVLMKHAFHRARPSFGNPLLALSTYSFPSGHVAGTTLFYGVLAAMLVSKIDAWRARVIIVATAFALVVLVALSRVYLGVHYLSDVLGGFAEAIAWLTLCLLGIHTYWQHRLAGQTLTSRKRT
jgi:undecaprenyl-diphosphatase